MGKISNNFEQKKEKNVKVPIYTWILFISERFFISTNLLTALHLIILVIFLLTLLIFGLPGMRY